MKNLNGYFEELLQQLNQDPQLFGQAFEMACKLGRLEAIDEYLDKRVDRGELYDTLATIYQKVLQKEPIGELPDFGEIQISRVQRAIMYYIFSLTQQDIKVKLELLKKGYTDDAYNLSIVKALRGYRQMVSIESLRQLYRAEPECFGYHGEQVVREQQQDCLFVPLGGGDEVGASAYFLRVDGFNILVDYGVKFAGEQLVYPDLDRLEEICPVDELDVIVITHAHLDHCGGLLELYKKCPKIQLLMTEQTKILMGCNMKSMAMTVSEQAVLEALLNRVASIPVGHNLKLFEGQLELRFYDAGHILGAVSVHIKTQNKGIFVTGDFCLDAQGTVGAMKLPEQERIDLVVTESTYGNRIQDTMRGRDYKTKLLQKEVTRQILEGKSILIPAFAIGRSQEVLVALKPIAEALKFRIYVDGLAAHMTMVYEELLGRELFRSPYIHLLKNHFYDTKAEFIEREFMQSPCCVVASSGMMNEGSIAAEYLKAVLPTTQGACILTGYQAEDTLGARLKHQMSIQGKRYLSIENELYPIKCEVREINLSAHPSMEDILGVVAYLEPSEVILVHGQVVDGESTILHQLLQNNNQLKVRQSNNNQIIHF
ncbi:MAG: MBL fold metallo-hydrolase [Cellulosilyticaceae bacterium]